jgi:hypothetical protein
MVDLDIVAIIVELHILVVIMVMNGTKDLA